MKDINRIEDLMVGGRFKSYLELQVNWLQYRSLISAIPENWKMLLESEETDEMVVSVYSKLKGNENVTRVVYNLLINNPSNVDKYYDRWLDRSLCLDYEDYVNSFESNRVYNKVIKLRDFQYRLLLGKIVTNSDLFEWGLSSDNLCCNCKRESETILHLLVECNIVKRIWYFVQEICKRCKIDANWTKENIILNRVTSPKHVINHIVLLCKQYIYSNRCMGKITTVKNFVKKLNDEFYLEYYSSIRTHSVRKFFIKWDPVIL